MMNSTNDYDISTSCTDNENNDIKISIKFLLLSIPGSVLLLPLIGLLLYTTLKPLLTINGENSIPNSSNSLNLYGTQRMWQKTIF